MAVQFDDIRVKTMLSLYASMAQERNSERLEILETALDFTLSEQRQPRSVAQLRRDVVRNARYTVNRTAQSRRQAAENRPLPDALHRRFTWRNDTGDVVVDIQTQVTPFDGVIAQDTLQALHRCACDIGAHGPICLQALIAGATTAETAKATGVSVSTVERCWRLLRAETLAMTTPGVRDY